MVEISPLIIRTFLESKFFLGSATAGVIIATGIIAAHFFSRFIGVLVTKFEWKDKFKKFGIKNPSSFIENATKYIIYVIAFMAALRRLGLFKTVFSIIGIVIISLLVIAMYLEFRDAAANFVAYFFIRNLRLAPKQIIKISGVEGEIKKISFFDVTLQTEKGDVIIIPNRLFIKSKAEHKGYKTSLP